MSTHIHVLRFLPGQDLKKAIQEKAVSLKIEAGWVLTGIGSLTKYHIRFADQQQGNERSGRFEILSLSGTVSVNGSHLHISVSDAEGMVTGGHLLDGCTIYTTAEIVIQSDNDLVFTREKDDTSGCAELKVGNK